MSMSTPLGTRNASLSDLVNLLKQQQAAKVDLVAPITALRSRNGVSTISGTSVFGEGGEFRPTEIADEHIAGKLGIPYQYLRRLREQRVDLYDHNVNGWVHGLTGPEQVVFPADERTVTLRTFQGEPGEPGILRAVLSDRYGGMVDHIDGLMAVLDGAREAGIGVRIIDCNLSERRMYVKLAAPEVFNSAEKYLEGYRSPRLGQIPQWAQDKFHVDGNGVFAGLVFSNSETGGGAWNLSPQIVTLTCLNGATMVRDAVRKVHIGSKMEEGVVAWSDDTRRKSLELIKAQTRDAVAAFLTPGYVEKALGILTEKTTKPVERPAETVQVVGKQLGFKDDEVEAILAHFIEGGQLTAGGIMQAITAFAQELASPDAAYEMELAGIKALELVAG